jgi:hypothetical protein
MHHVGVMHVGGALLCHALAKRARCESLTIPPIPFPLCCMGPGLDQRLRLRVRDRSRFRLRLRLRLCFRFPSRCDLHSCMHRRYSHKCMCKCCSPLPHVQVFTPQSVDTRGAFTHQHMHVCCIIPFPHMHVCCIRSLDGSRRLRRTLCLQPQCKRLRVLLS